LKNLLIIVVFILLVSLYIVNDAAATPFNDKSQSHITPSSTNQQRTPIRYNSTLYERYHGKHTARAQPTLQGFNDKNGDLRKNQFSAPSANYVQRDNCAIVTDNTFNDRSTAERICQPTSRQFQAYYP